MMTQLQKGTLFPSLNPKFTHDPITVCPCCNQVSLETAYQAPLIEKPGRTGYVLCHCINPDCAGYALTLKRETFLATMQETRQAMKQEANSDE